MEWSVVGGEKVALESGGAPLSGHLGRPLGAGRRPAIVLVHGIGGLKESNMRVADRLAEAGYVALAIDWRSQRHDPHDREIVQYVADALTYLRSLDTVDPDRLAVGGYCRGGAIVYAALATFPELRAGVAFHATLRESVEGTDRLQAFDYVEKISAPLLMLHGAADATSPVALTYRMAERLEANGKEFELKVYGGAGHGFALPDGRQFHPSAAGDALAEAIGFLRHRLR